MDRTLIRIVCTILAVAFLGMIVMRRKKQADNDEDVIGTDLIEYALMVGFVATAAGAIMPGVADNLLAIWERIGNQPFPRTRIGG